MRIAVPPPKRELMRAEQLAAEEDPSADGWWIEAVAEKLERRLGELGRLVERPGTMESAHAASLVAADFACDALVPSHADVLRADGLLRVRRWSAPEARVAPEAAPRYGGAEGLAAALGELRASLAEGREPAEVGLEFLVLGIEQEGDELSADVLVSAWARGTGSSAQQGSTWRCRFSAARPDREPLFSWIGLESWEEAVLEGRRAILEDVTASVMGADPTYAAQVVPSIDHWLPRISQVAGMTNIGHHGIAIGDVDGDGLEDLYVCENGGLPNRLYKQNPDGTVTDVAARARVDFLDHSASALLVDLDDDGDLDLVVAMRSLLLFAQNDGTGRFTSRVRIRTGVGAMSLSAADFDLDGDLDVYVCMYNAHPDSEGIAYPYHDANNGAANLLLRNVGDFRFIDATAEVGLDVNNHRFSFAAAWDDFDGDGWPDLYVANDFGQNCLYRNEGGRFTEIAQLAGVEDIASGMSAAWGDYDRDGWMDVYVANMYSPEGMRVTSIPRFTQGHDDEALAALRRMTRGNTLYANQGDGTFRDVSVASRSNLGRWAWGSLFVDLDGDGWQDLVVTNGYYTMQEPRDLRSFYWRHVVSRSPRAQPSKRELDDYTAWWLAATHLVKRGWSYNGNERNCAYLNLGDGSFADVSAVSGFDYPDDGRAVAFVDWTGNGALDLWVRNRSSPRLRLLANRLAPGEGGGDFVAFMLRGTNANRDGIGARVIVELAGEAQRPIARTHYAGDGFLAQSSRWLHFGLGRDPRIERVSVRWPGGATETFEGVQPGGRYLLVEESGRAVAWQRPGGPVELLPAPQSEPVPSDLAAVLLAARFPAPILRWLPPGEQSPRALELGAGPLLVQLFASWSEAALAELDELGRRAGELRALGLDVLALSVDELADDPRTGRRAAAGEAEAALARLRFPFRTGRATGELLDKIEIVQDFLFDLVPPVTVPMGLLIDGEGRLSAIHRGPVAFETLLSHASSLDAVIERRYALAMPFPGDWKVMATDVGEMAAANWFLDRYVEDSERYYELAASKGALASGLQGGGANRARAHLRLAELRMAAGRADEGIALLRQAIELDPGLADARRALGDALSMRGEIDEAIEQYRAALALAPALAALHYGLGNAFTRKGRTDEAIGAFRRTVELVPSHAEAFNNLGNALLGRGEVDEALECYDKALAVEPELYSSHYARGAALAMRGEREPAAAAYSRALHGKPEYADVHFQRGLGHLAEGRLDDAVEFFSLVLEVRPDFAEAWYRRGVARAQLGASAAALEDLRKAESLAASPELRAEAARLAADLR